MLYWIQIKLIDILIIKRNIKITNPNSTLDNICILGLQNRPVKFIKDFGRRNKEKKASSRTLLEGIKSSRLLKLERRNIEVGQNRHVISGNL